MSGTDSDSLLLLAYHSRDCQLSDETLKEIIPLPSYISHASMCLSF